MHAFNRSVKQNCSTFTVDRSEICFIPIEPLKKPTASRPPKDANCVSNTKVFPYIPPSARVIRAFLFLEFRGTRECFLIFIFQR